MFSDTELDILPLLHEYARGTADHRSTEQLVQEALTRTSRMIFWVAKRRGFRLQPLGLSLRDMACDTIAELFSEDTSGTSLRSALASAAGESDEELLSAFDAMLLRMVYGQFMHFFAEIDPETHRILRALRHHVSIRDDVTVLDMLDGRWYLFGGEEHACLHLPSASVEDLRRSLGPLDPKNRSAVIEMLRRVEEFLRGQSEFRRAVPESDILRLTAEYLGQKAAPSETTVEGASVAFDVAVLTHVIHRAIERVRDSLERFYLDRGKLGRGEFENMLRAIRGAFLDDRLGGEDRSNFTQLREYMPGLTLERYHASYRRKYTYMYDRVLEEAQKLLDKEVL